MRHLVFGSSLDRRLQMCFMNCIWRGLFEIREVLFFIPWYSSQLNSQLFEVSDLEQIIFFGPRGKNMELIWFALTLRLICLITRKCLIQNQRNRCYLLNFSTVHIPSSSYHELAIGAAVGHLPVFNVTVLWQYIDLSETRCCFSLQAVCMGFFWYSAVHFRQAAS